MSRWSGECYFKIGVTIICDTKASGLDSVEEKLFDVRAAITNGARLLHQFRRLNSSAVSKMRKVLHRRREDRIRVGLLSSHCSVTRSVGFREWLFEVSIDCLINLNGSGHWTSFSHQVTSKEIVFVCVSTIDSMCTTIMVSTKMLVWFIQLFCIGGYY